MNAAADTDRDDAMIEGQARVVRVEAGRAWLRPERAGACAGCASHHHCTSTFMAPREWSVPLSGAGDGLPLRVGDQLRVGVERQALLRAGAIAYGLPLAATLAAALGSFALGAGDALSALSALAGLVAGIAAARAATRRWTARLAPVVLGRAADGVAAAGCEAKAMPVRWVDAASARGTGR